MKKQEILKCLSAFNTECANYNYWNVNPNQKEQAICLNRIKALINLFEELKINIGTHSYIESESGNKYFLFVFCINGNYTIPTPCFNLNVDRIAMQRLCQFRGDC